jgi:hypothetical protein
LEFDTSLSPILIFEFRWLARANCSLSIVTKGIGSAEFRSFSGRIWLYAP